MILCCFFVHFTLNADFSVVSFGRLSGSNSINSLFYYYRRQGYQFCAVPSGCVPLGTTIAHARVCSTYEICILWQHH